MEIFSRDADHRVHFPVEPARFFVFRIDLLFRLYHSDTGAAVSFLLGDDGKEN
jgi:hypothetical protein